MKLYNSKRGSSIRKIIEVRKVSNRRFFYQHLVHIGFLSSSFGKSEFCKYQIWTFRQHKNGTFLVLWCSQQLKSFRWKRIRNINTFKSGGIWTVLMYLLSIFIMYRVNLIYSHLRISGFDLQSMNLLKWQIVLIWAFTLFIIPFFNFSIWLCTVCFGQACTLQFVSRYAINLLI